MYILPAVECKSFTSEAWLKGTTNGQVTSNTILTGICIVTTAQPVSPSTCCQVTLHNKQLYCLFIGVLHSSCTCTFSVVASSSKLEGAGAGACCRSARVGLSRSFESWPALRQQLFGRSRSTLLGGLCKTLIRPRADVTILALAKIVMARSAGNVRLVSIVLRIIAPVSDCYSSAMSECDCSLAH